ncbi:hypothetical protein TPHA_0H03040 [Tetrapisispora phaffii CBS 4417]|uniref:DNA damage checkpoint control protein RAD17 n=1 Tax=Tetrapisispora phaffii (strain ATCC 24235 / CBS 4417 / NBRC 1672 / NRRL Y-8282 / UCD 70-5) TaxID=1071381 RepID=G8BWQ6_TETPH|nr:hypothetical protein TPHA_0H03040 [Tetrapisispora phaffii CBS 4417]CCE64507.1 hypothetical protein TPHA_0H03040 [Tetrapisispora phaffii CBS 4417]
MRIPKGEGAKFSATTVYLEHLTTALSCLVPFGNKDDVLIFIDKDGLSFVRDNNHVIRIQLFLSRELFMSYSFENEIANDQSASEAGAGTHNEQMEDHLKVSVKINHILDSVSIINRNVDDIVECTLFYNGYGTPFVLAFEDSLISERVAYSTYLTKEIDNTGLELDRSQIIFECMVKGDVLYTALKDLKEIGCKECYIYAKSNDNPMENVFALISKSQLGFSKIKIPSSRSILEKLQVYDGDSTTKRNNEPVIGFFDFNTFDKIRISTKIASKVLFRMDVHGLLSVNILSQTDDVMVSDVRNSKKTSNAADNLFNFDSYTNQKQMQLPKDYPGIVIEICMLEKEAIDSLAQEEIALLMDTNDTTGMSEITKRQTIAVNKLTDQTSPLNHTNGNILGLNGKVDDKFQSIDESSVPVNFIPQHDSNGHDNEGTQDRENRKRKKTETSNSSVNGLPLFF